METTEKSLLLKLFVGFQITTELRMHLNQSIMWKKAQIVKEFEPNHLVEVRLQEISYMGKFLDEPAVHLSELQKHDVELHEKLHEYCPMLKQEKFKLFILYQQLIP